MTLALPLSLGSPFLNAGSASAAAVEREIHLLGLVANEGLPAQFQALTDLQFHYFQNRRGGGLKGMAWIEQERKNLIASVNEEERFREFVSFREDGSAHALFPRDLVPPPTLNFSEEWGRPDVIPLEASGRMKAMDLAYFLVGALLFLEAPINWDKVESARSDLRHRRDSVPLNVATSPDRTAFFGDGLDRAVAVYLSGTPYILGRINDGYPGKRGLRLPQVLGLPQKKSAAAPMPVPIVTTLQFRPRFDAEFPPVKTTLLRNGRPCPVVIERVDPDDAPHLPPDLREEMERKLDAEKNGPGRPFFRAIRALDGETLAVSLSFLVSELGKIRMRCDRTVKSDRDSANQLQGVGLAFLVSALNFMKRSGHWHESGELLYNLIPRVADAIRRSAGLAAHRSPASSVALDGITAREGEEFLRKSNLRFESALTPPAPAPAEAVFLDGRPAG